MLLGMVAVVIASRFSRGLVVLRVRHRTVRDALRLWPMVSSVVLVLVLGRGLLGRWSLRMLLVVIMLTLLLLMRVLLRLWR